MLPSCGWQHDEWSGFCCWCGRFIYDPKLRSRLILKDGQDPHICCPHCLDKALDYPSNWRLVRELITGLANA